MILLIISDLHIDAGGKLGTFGWKPKKFIKTLNKIISFYNVNKIILNGDIFDLYKNSISEILRANKKILKFFRKNNCILIRGNHDIWLSNSLDHYDIINSKGNIIHIEHGHKADFMNGTKFGRFLAIFLYTLLKFFVKFKYVERLYFKVISRIEDMHRIPRKYNTLKYLLYALRLLKKYDMVILGHTHKLEEHKLYYLNQKKIYLNCGTCSMGRLQAIILNTETLKYETIKIPKKTKLKLEELPIL